jgi:queuine tRNA-ribosyltransferase/7-cyano-7-deazaguanine tRNA-ribosyltransferase
LPFDGFAIGGVAVGESKEDMARVLSWVMPFLPDEKPRHLLGVGEIDDIFTLIDAGVDTFDCVQATRLARMGHLFIQNADEKFRLDITKKEYATSMDPIDHTCHCYTCTHYSRAYLYHLFHVRELLAYRLATIHNIAFINSLVSSIRKSIVEGTYQQLKKQWMTV